MSKFIKSVVRGSAWLIAANILTKTLNILLAFVLIRGLDVETYGFLMTIWGGAALLAGGLDLGMSQSLVRDGARDHSIIHSLVQHIIRIRVPLTVVMLVAMIIGGEYFVEYSLEPHYMSRTMLIALAAFIPIVDNWHFPFAFLCHIFNEFKTVAIYRCLYFIAVLLAVAAFVFLFHSVELVVSAYAVVTVISIFIFCKYASRLIPSEDQREVTFKFAIKQGMPFFAINMLALFYMRIELLLLGAMLGSFESGVYCAQYQIIVLFFMVPALVHMTLMPSLYKRSKETEFLRKVFSIASRYLNLYALLVIPLIIYLAEELMGFVGGDELRAEADGLRYLALMLLSLYATISLNFLNVLDLLGKRIAFESIGIVLLVGIGIFVIPIYGIEGLALVASVAYGVTGVLAFVSLVRYGVVDVPQFFVDVFRILPAVILGALVFFIGPDMKWVNAMLYVAITLTILCLTRFWNQTDFRILKQVMDLRKISSEKVSDESVS